MERLVIESSDPAVRSGGLFPRRQEDSGFLLPATLGILLFFSLTVVAILAYTLTVLTSVTEQSLGAADRRSGDSAMEVVISRLRADRDGLLGSGASGAPCAGPSAVYEVVLPPTEAPGSAETMVSVACTSRESTGNRTVELAAHLDGPSGRVLAKSLVRIIDSPSPGYRITVCDWRLGASDGAMTPCPATP